MSHTDEEFFSENLTRINKIIGKIFVVFCAVPVVFILFTLLGIWKISYAHSAILLIISGVFSFILIYLNKKNTRQTFVMYVGIILGCFIVAFMSYIGTVRLYISYAIVPIISLLYYNKKLTRIACFINYFLIIFSAILSADLNYEVSSGRFSKTIYLIQFISGLTIESIFLIIALSGITNRNQKTLINLMLAFDEKNEVYEQLKERNKLIIKINNELEEKNNELKSTQSKIIKFVSKCLGSHDLFTGRHIIHTQKYVEMICKQLAADGHYAKELSEENVAFFQLAAFLHDIGKIHIPEGVLNKTGKFTQKEFELMKSHPQEGEKLLDYLPPIEDGTFNKIAKEMTLYHHEKWDGTGYPFGLKEKEIPLSARIMTAADVLDALISQRLYKDPMTIDEAISVFEKSSGTHFEPCIVHAVIKNKSLIALIDRDFKISETETNALELEWWKSYHENFRNGQS